MSDTKLLLAAAVWHFAAELRHSDRPDFETEEEWKSWFAAHPISQYVPATLKRLQDIADQIKQLET